MWRKVRGKCHLFLFVFLDVLLMVNNGSWCTMGVGVQFIQFSRPRTVCFFTLTIPIFYFISSDFTFVLITYLNFIHLFYYLFICYWTMTFKCVTFKCVKCLRAGLYWNYGTLKYRII